MADAAIATPPANLWDHIRDGLQFAVHQNKRVTDELLWFKKNPKFLTHTSQRAEPFLFHIVAELERRHLPLDLALVPIVESAYKAKAYSRSHASGIWQFIPGTGRRFGLKQDWWYDERRDVIKATNAALDYLSSLYKRFNNDWLLAIAAYNSGELNIERAIQHNRRKGLPVDFWALELRRETREYVPKILAVAQIIANPSAFGQTLAPVANRPYFVTVATGRPVDLRQIASTAGVSTDLFEALNANYRQHAAGPAGPFDIHVPIASEAPIRDAIASAPTYARADWQRYTIQKGDTLSLLASRFDTTVKALQEANSMSGSFLRAGHDLLIPPIIAAGNKPRTSAVVADRNVPPPQAGTLIHTVRAGDTLSALARRYGSSITQLARLNGIAANSTLHLNQQLTIHASVALPESTTINRQITYQVRKGDSLWSISNRFDVTVPDLQRWNALNANRHLQPGQTLTVYLPSGA